MVEARVPVAPERFRLVDEAGQLVVNALGHRTRVRTGLESEARRQLDAHRPLERPRRRNGRVTVVHHLEREVGGAAAALFGDLDEYLAAMAALEGQLAAIGVIGRGNVRRHVEAGRHHVVRGNDDGASRRRPRRRDHDAQGVLRPADEVVVVLEVPLRLHRVFSLPEDFRLPRHGHAGRTCRDVGGHDREELAVVGIGQLLALGGLVLLKIRRVGVVGVGRKPGGDDRIELVVRVAAAGGLQTVPDLGVERRHGRRTDLHDDVRDHVVLRLGIVVGEHELPLRTVYRARLRVHPVAHGQKLRLRRVVVEAVNDVGDAQRCLAVFALQEVRVAEELHELAGEVDERSIVGLIDPRREEPVRTG